MKRNRFIPYGYHMTKGQISIHPQEGRIVIGIFEQYLQGISPAKMATQLNENGVCFHAANPSWNKGRIYRILADERYTGIDQYPALVDKCYLDAAKERIARNRTYRTPDDVLARSVSGKLRCDCGERVNRAAGSRWSCPCCGKEIRSDTMEQEIRLFMARIWSDPRLIDSGKAAPYVPTTEIMKLNSEIRRAINNKGFDAVELRKLILRCASLKYDALQTDLTPFIRGVIEKYPIDSLRDTEHIARLVSMIVEGIFIESPDRLRIKLKNGAIIRTIKEDSNGNGDE